MSSRWSTEGGTSLGDSACRLEARGVQSTIAKEEEAIHPPREFLEVPREYQGGREVGVSGSVVPTSRPPAIL